MKWFTTDEYEIDGDCNYVMSRSFARELILTGMFDEYTCKRRLDRRDILIRTKLFRLYKRTKLDFLFRERVIPVISASPSMDDMLQLVDNVVSAGSLRKYMRHIGYYYEWRTAKFRAAVPMIKKGLSLNYMAKECSIDRKELKDWIRYSGWLDEYRAARRKANQKVYF